MHLAAFARNTRSPADLGVSAAIVLEDELFLLHNLFDEEVFLFTQEFVFKYLLV